MSDRDRNVCETWTYLLGVWYACSKYKDQFGKYSYGDYGPAIREGLAKDTDSAALAFLT